MRLKSLFWAFLVFAEAEKCKNGGTKIEFQKNGKKNQVSIPRLEIIAMIPEMFKHKGPENGFLNTFELKS